MIGKVSRPVAVIWPVAPGSSKDLSVLPAVELVRSDDELHTPDIAVKSAVTVLGAGVGGGLAGHTPKSELSLTSARLRLPTTRLSGLNRAEPEAPGLTLPIPLTTPQNVES